MFWTRLAAITLSALLTGALGAGCSTSAHYANGQLEYQGDIGLSKRDQFGEWTYWHENGKLEAQGHFEKDRQVGHWTYWYDNGNEEMSGGFHDNRREGLWRYYYRNGQPRTHGIFRAGREHGEWTFFTPEGLRSRAGEFFDGKQTLRWLSWHADGRRKSEGCYHDGVRIGLWRFWDQNENAAEETTETLYPLPSGVAVLRENWPSGLPRREGLLRNGRPIGRWLTWHEDGSRRLVGEFIGGHPAGTWIAYDADGNRIASGEVKDGLPVGEWVGDVRGVEQHWSPDPVRRPPPFSGEWSDASIITALSPAQVTEVWLAEVAAADFSESIVVQRQSKASAPASLTVDDKLVVPVRAQPWTVRERENLERYKQNYGMTPPPPEQRASGLYEEADSSSVARSPVADPVGNKIKSDPLLGRDMPVTRFTCADGSLLDLNDLRGQKVLVVILRGYGGQVCVYCVAQTGALEQAKDEFLRADTEVVVVYPGPKSSLDAFFTAYRITFRKQPKPSYRMIYDPDLTLVKALDIDADLAIPTSILIDENGKICECYVGQNIEDRPPARFWVDKLEHHSR